VSAPHYQQENAESRERLQALTAKLTDAELEIRMPNGWTVAVTLAHLAFWDLSQVVRLKKWTDHGITPASLDADAVNDALRVLSEAIPPRETLALVLGAAETIDGLLEKLTPDQADQLMEMGLERNLRRSLHRTIHLDKIDEVLKKKSDR
jgi:hypothetical protein